MKVLQILPYSPVPPTWGGAMRVYHLLKNLARCHDVTVILYGSEDDRARLKKEFGSRIRTIHLLPHPAESVRWKRLAQFYTIWTGHSFLYRLILNDTQMQSLIDKVLSEDDFHFIQIEGHLMGLFRYNSGAIKILDTQNVEYDSLGRMAERTRSRIRRLYYNVESKRVRREEIDLCSRHDAILVTSARDKSLLDADVPQVPKFVVPNGVDSAFFAPSQSDPERNSLVFTGAMGYVPNSDAMLYFLDEVFPLIEMQIPEVKIYIVGSRPPGQLRRRASERVIVTDYVEDVRPFVHRSSVYVVPLRMGGGTRLKVLEAMAMKKPIVTTSIGCEGIDVAHEETVLIADTPQAFADATAGLLHNTRLQQRLIRNGFELMKSRYEWSVIGTQMESAIQSLYEENKTDRKVCA
jgi:glycosyltransferase involved in cell wall biosynthesis